MMMAAAQLQNLLSPEYLPGVLVSVGLALLGVLVAAARNFNSWLYEPRLPAGKKMPPGDLGWPIIGDIRTFLHYFKSGNPDGYVGSMVKRFAYYIVCAVQSPRSSSLGSRVSSV